MSHLRLCSQNTTFYVNNSCKFIFHIINKKNIRIYISSSSHAISTDVPDPPPPPFLIVHCLRQVFMVTSHIGTELLYIGSIWSSCLCSTMWRDPHEYLTYELVPAYPAMCHMSGLSNFDSFCDGWLVAVQLLVCGVLPPWLIITFHFANKYFFHTVLVNMNIFLNDLFDAQMEHLQVLSLQVRVDIEVITTNKCFVFPISL